MSWLPSWVVESLWYGLHAALLGGIVAASAICSPGRTLTMLRVPMQSQLIDGSVAHSCHSAGWVSPEVSPARAERVLHPRFGVEVTGRCTASIITMTRCCGSAWGGPGRSGRRAGAVPRHVARAGADVRDGQPRAMRPPISFGALRAPGARARARSPTPRRAAPRARRWWCRTRPGGGSRS